MSTTETEATPTTTQKKWHTAEPLPGPRQVKWVNKAIRKCHSESIGEIELDGVIGQPETERRSMTFMLYGSGPNPGTTELIAEVAERFNYTVTKSNAAEIIKAYEDLVPKIRALRPIKDKRITPEAHAAHEAEMQAFRDSQKAKDAQAAEAGRAALAILREKLKGAPAGTQALIVAELMQDDSDSMTDYFASHSVRRVAIGFRTGSREDFRQLRRAAANFSETAHLGPDCDDFLVQAIRTVADGSMHGQVGYLYPVSGGLHGKRFSTEAEAQAAIDAATAAEKPDVYEWKIQRSSIEHRDNYSMGAGNYLQVGGGHRSGWRVRSRDLPGPNATSVSYDFPTEWALPEKPAADDTGSAATVLGTGYKVESYVHTKKGTRYWQVELTDRVDRDAFERIRSSCKAAGGWYSRQWGRIPGGFAFDSLEAADSWAQKEIGGAK